MTLTNIDHEKQIYCFKVFYAFLVVLLLHMNNPCIGCSERDRQALLALKQGLVGNDGNRLLSWGRVVQNKDCCQWAGVYCSNHTGHVVKLDLGDQSLQGTISPKLVELQHLEYLNLSFNDFSWRQIPDFIGSLSNLRYLDLSYANFGGEIPYQLENLTHLEYLNLSSDGYSAILLQNSIHAKNLNWLPNLSGLKHLDLSSTNLSDVVGWLEAVNMLPKLRNLILVWCNLPPPIISSASFMNSSNSLVHVDLSFNNLNSSIFQLLSGTHTNLVHLDLSRNNFTGVVGWLEAVNMLPKLRNLILYGCNLPPPIISSVSLMNSSNSLVHVDLSFNNLNSSIFQLLSGTHTNLVHLDLSGNNFTGVVGWLEAVNMLPKLRNLILQGCNLPPPIISSVSLMNSSNSLVRVDLSSNNLNSSIFQWLSGTHTNLVHLDLSWNNFTGVVGWLEAINMLPKLRNLILQECNLPPPIISSVSLMNSSNSLVDVDLSYNNLNSSIFQWLSGTHTNLVDLDLSANNFTGVVGWLEAVNMLPKLRNLILRGCNLPPPIISSVSLMNSSKSLVHIDLFSNNLNSSIFQLLSGTHTNLVDLDLSANNFTGAVVWLEAVNMLPKLRNLILRGCNLPPPIISSVSLMNSSKSLVHVDLSSNNLNSSIFQWLSGTHTNLVHLDLSWNNFTGVVGWLEAVNMLPKLRNLILYECNLPPPIISSVSLMNSSNSLVHADLSYNNLNSSIFQWLSGTQTNLVDLDLSENNFNGSSIPDAFGNMSSLAYLTLYGSRLKGGIPNSFAKLCRLQELHLANNSLSGQLSDIIDILSKCAQNTLEDLDISDNHGIMGSVPDLTNFLSLKYLNLRGNNLSGRIPKSIGQMSKLEMIDFGGNSLEGVISEIHFSKLFKLWDLDLSSNSLVLNFHFDWVPPFQLEWIRLRSCKMGPSFPKWLQTQKSVSDLDISDNGITDTIPSWIWELKIFNMDLSQNQIRGTLGNLRSEFPPKLNVSWNQLEGPIPSTLSEVIFLDLSNNNFSVAAASFLCTTKDSDLIFLDISSNHIFGELPECWIHFKKLVFLDLSNNSLYGKIPTTMGYLFSIETLRLNNNGFVGELPSQFKNCRNLTLFNLAENKLSGSIPEWLGASHPNLAILILQSNNFCGSIPQQLCHLTRIQLLDLSMNNISGTIPKCLNSLTTLVRKGSSSQTIGHVYRGHHAQRYFSGVYNDEASLIWKGLRAEFKSNLGLLKSIDLSSNKLIGEIPREITYLLGLISLNLSRNQLTGQIPSRIGNLQELESLDLSRNQINGTIPTSLSWITRLAKLDLSENNLFGKIPIGTQLQSFDYAYGGNPLLCGAPLPGTCPEEENGPGQPVLVNQDSQDGLITQGYYISMGLGFAIGFWGVCGTLLLNRSCRYAYFNFLTFLSDWLHVKVAIIRQRMLNR